MTRFEQAKGVDMSKALGHWNGRSIRVMEVDSDYVNATDMCKATGKEWAGYIRNESTQEFVAALAAELKHAISHVIRSTPGKGGTTWVHRRVAIHLAQWCSPEFAVWVTGRIEELMTNGVTSLSNQATQESALIARMDQFLTNSMQQMEYTKNCIQRCDQFYEVMRNKPIEQWERLVNDQLQRDEGGRPVKLPNGDKVDLYLPHKYVIEVKHFSNWKHAIGQVVMYADNLCVHFGDIDAEMRIHLFWKHKCDAMPTEAKRLMIQRSCKRKNIFVTWHEWPELFPIDHQKRLDLRW